MRDVGEQCTKTLVREFCEEALSHDLKFDKSNRIIANSDIEKDVKAFFKTGTKVKILFFAAVRLQFR
jgi:hypothetical protein